MDYEKALNEFETMLPMTDESEQFYPEILCAIECIKKQIEKTPTLEEVGFYEVVGYRFYCGSCGMQLDQKNDYCGKCGQKIDWR